jgi:hypothetical protein
VFHDATTFEANLLLQWMNQHISRRLKATNNFGFGEELDLFKKFLR